MKLVECVPNFSEGRDPAVLDAIIESMLAVPGVLLLGREMDADHNRSVVTLAGFPAAVAEAAVRGAGKAAELIDLRQHHGEHPRLGATDVIPFVPLELTTLEECVRLAEWAGEQIWKRFGVPVYLYEAAARHEHRRKLEDVRRGQFEQIRQLAESDARYRPDFGDARLHPSAGASIVGARKFLIAYNINLDTPEVEIARAIAKKIRTSGGGLPALKAMGVYLGARNCAQVSMNLTDFEQTSLYTVWQAVKKEAAALGATAVESEIVGLVPARALEECAAEALKIRVFEPQMVIENRLRQVTASEPLRWELTLQPWMDALASHAPTPGGGSAAAACAAMSASLGQMVAAATLRRLRKTEADAAKLARLQNLDGELATIRADMLRSTDRDAQAFEALRQEQRRWRNFEDKDDRGRAEAYQRMLAATLAAAEVPLQVAVAAQKLLGLLQQLQPLHWELLASDLVSARAFAEAARTAAIANVETNLADLPPEMSAAEGLRAQLRQLRQAG